jgi:uroporphyrinogen-III decarboxylase
VEREKVEITDAMIEAGVNALCLFDPGEDSLVHTVQAVYEAMFLARPHLTPTGLPPAETRPQSPA